MKIRTHIHKTVLSVALDCVRNLRILFYLNRPKLCSRLFITSFKFTTPLKINTAKMISSKCWIFIVSIILCLVAWKLRYKHWCSNTTFSFFQFFSTLRLSSYTVWCGLWSIVSRQLLWPLWSGNWALHIWLSNWMVWWWV